MTYFWIQLLLIGGSLTAAALFIRRWDAAHTRAWKRLAFLAFMLLSVYAVLRPSDVTWAANHLGVGRGADLVLYLMVLALAFVALNTYLRFRAVEKKLTDLARTVAINEAVRVNGERFGA